MHHVTSGTSGKAIVSVLGLSKSVYNLTSEFTTKNTLTPNGPLLKKGSLFLD